VTLPAKTKFDPGFAIADKDGKPTQQFRDYLTKLDLVISLLLTNSNASLTNAANDAAAALAGVQVGQLYRNGSVIQVRVA
jgi:hypothetical protein